MMRWQFISTKRGEERNIHFQALNATTRSWVLHTCTFKIMGRWMIHDERGMGLLLERTKHFLREIYIAEGRTIIRMVKGA